MKIFSFVILYLLWLKKESSIENCSTIQMWNLLYTNFWPKPHIGDSGFRKLLNLEVFNNLVVLYLY